MARGNEKTHKSEEKPPNAAELQVALTETEVLNEEILNYSDKELTDSVAALNDADLNVMIDCLNISMTDTLNHEAWKKLARQEIGSALRDPKRAMTAIPSLTTSDRCEILVCQAEDYRVLLEISDVLEFLEKTH